MTAYRNQLPRETWRDLVKGAESYLHLLGYAMQFIPEDVVDFCDVAAAKAAESCDVRILLGDPDSEVVSQRDREEELHGQLPHRIRTTLRHLRPLAGQAGIGVRFHATPLYCSVFRADDRIIYTPHLYGQPGYLSPAFDVQRDANAALFANLEGHFDRVWETATPVESW